MLPLAVLLMVGAGVLLAGLAGHVWRRRGIPAGLSLAVLLLAVAWWGLAYALEISSDALGAKRLWGDLKYVGIGVLGPAWLAFVLQYTGRGHLLTGRRLLALAVEPVAVQLLLAFDATHDLIRFYQAPTADDALPVVGTGPLFWVHFGYINLLLVVATALFVVSLARLSRLYWRMSAVLLAAALLPWAANLLHNLSVGPFVRLDLTPFAFIVTGAVLVWGLLRERLLDLAPVARSVVVETMTDAVLVLDAYGRVVDANPAASGVLGERRSELAGRPLTDLLPGYAAAGGEAHPPNAPALETELTLPVRGETRHFDVRRQPLPDRRGQRAGELVVLRDVTERKLAETQLRQLLAERSRIARALQASLLPTTLPKLPGAQVAARYRPAGEGREIGGDFYDLYRISQERWALVLGDVSGKGAEAAAMTALVRYTLRTLTREAASPSEALRELNDAMLRQTTDERYCTLVSGLVEPHDGGLRMTLCLGGHHQPLLRRNDGTVEPTGRLGSALGLLDDPDLHDTVVDLGQGDLICLYTDGLVEARRGPDLFGVSRAASVLAEQSSATPDSAADRLEAAARGFRGGPLNDDLALMLLQAS